MEITIKNTQRLIRISPRRIERVLRKALTLLAHKDRNALSVTRDRFVKGKKDLLLSVEVSVLFANDRRMRELNRLYRGKDKTTDVLSFPLISEKWEAGSKKSDKHKKRSKTSLSSHFLLPTSYLPLGDIVISLPQAKRQAEAYGAPLYEELARLLVHGLLHLLGYDHERNAYQARKMRTLESEVLEDLCRSGG